MNVPNAGMEFFTRSFQSKTFYLDNDCKDIWSWSEKVYEFVKGEKR